MTEAGQMAKEITEEEEQSAIDWASAMAVSLTAGIVSIAASPEEYGKIMEDRDSPVVQTAMGLLGAFRAHRDDNMEGFALSIIGLISKIDVDLPDEFSFGLSCLFSHQTSRIHTIIHLYPEIVEEYIDVCDRAGIGVPRV